MVVLHYIVVVVAQFYCWDHTIRYCEQGSCDGMVASKETTLQLLCLHTHYLLLLAKSWVGVAVGWGGRSGQTLPVSTRLGWG